MSNNSHEKPEDATQPNGGGLKRRDLLLSGSSLVAASALVATGFTSPAQAQQQGSGTGSDGRGSDRTSCSSWATTSAGSTSAPITGA